MKVFGAQYFDELISKAQRNTRKRQHQNIHDSYEEACQRLFNAIEPESYIRPHRHATEGREELLVAMRGSMVLVTFSDAGIVTNSIRFSADKGLSGLVSGVEVPGITWHTVVALEPGSVLLEVKAGPFNPRQPKDLAQWAPEEGSFAAREYLNKLREKIDQ